jgi:H+/Cl- antiporter ClcA
MISFSRRRKFIQLRNQIKAPLTLNPFVFSRSFFIWTILGIAAGIVTGLYWIIISFLMRYTHNFTLGWEIILIMGAGGFIIGLVIHLWGDPGKLDIVVNNVRFNGGRLDTKNNVPMIITSALGIGIGSNAGPEAPMVQVVGSLGSWFARKFKLKGSDHRALSIAGMAAGFTTMFGSPIGGSLFALEIMHHKRITQYYQALIPAFVTSGTAYIVFQLITRIGLAPVWKLPFAFHIDDGVWDILWAMVYGTAGAIVGWVIIWSFRILEQGFEKAKLPFYIQTTLSGLILGFLGWQVPITRYFSHFELIDLLHGSWTLGILIVIILVKIFSMTLTVTSGWRGGFIIPIFFIGVTLGMILFKLYPGQNLGLAIVCCMAAVNACVTRTIISSILLVATLTGYASIVPILFAGLTGFFLAPRTPMIAAHMGKEKLLLED